MSLLSNIVNIVENVRNSAAFAMRFPKTACNEENEVTWPLREMKKFSEKHTKTDGLSAINRECDRVSAENGGKDRCTPFSRNFTQDISLNKASDADISAEESISEGRQEILAKRLKFIRTKRSLDTESVGKKLQLDRAMRSLQQYNPNFQLTAEVVEIIRLFFDDLSGEQRGWITFDDILRELEQLDPKNELVPQDIRQMMHEKWKQAAQSTGESLDSTDNLTNEEALNFEAFCTWVMLVREISPSLLRTVYTSWAKEIAIVDFGLPQEEDGLFVLRSPVGAVLSSHHPTSGLFATITGRLPDGDRRITPHKSLPAGLATDSFHVDHDDSSRLHVADSRHATSEAEIAPKEKNSLQNKSAIITMSKSFIAGASAGIIAKSVLAPADRVKIIFQVSEDTKFTFRNAFNLGKKIYTQDGFRALFRGNLLNIMRVVPYAGLQHSTFDLFRRQFHAYNTKHLGVCSDSKLSNYQLVVAGSSSGGVSLMIAYPLDIIRARYTVQQGKNQFGSIMEAVRAMYKADGLRSFTRGMVPSLLGTLPYTGIGFSLNEKFKTWVHDFQSKGRKDPQPSLHPIYKFACSYMAACVAQTCTYPMDTIRRRIQTDGYLYSNSQCQQPRYTGVITSARLIMQREGWRGFFKGVSVNWLRSPLATGISLTAYDLLKEVMGVEKVA